MKRRSIPQILPKSFLHSLESSRSTSQCLVRLPTPTRPSRFARTDSYCPRRVPSQLMSALPRRHLQRTEWTDPSSNNGSVIVTETPQSRTVTTDMCVHFRSISFFALTYTSFRLLYIHSRRATSLSKHLLYAARTFLEITSSPSSILRRSSSVLVHFAPACSQPVSPRTTTSTSPAWKQPSRSASTRLLKVTSVFVPKFIGCRYVKFALLHALLPTN